MEGKNTEPDYFRAMRAYYRGALIDLEIIAAAGVPLTIAQKAVATKKSIARATKKQSWLLGDQVWAIFDHDNHPNLPEALGLCREADVGIAYSNPCFELWLILHEQDYGRQDGHKAVQKHLESICPVYDSNGSKRVDCHALMPKVEQAEVRARQLAKQRVDEGDPLGRPMTTMFNLTHAIRHEVKQ